MRPAELAGSVRATSRWRSAGGTGRGSGSVPVCVPRSGWSRSRPSTGCRWIRWLPRTPAGPARLLWRRSGRGGTACTPTARGYRIGLRYAGVDPRHALGGGTRRCGDRRDRRVARPVEPLPAYGNTW